MPSRDFFFSEERNRYLSACMYDMYMEPTNAQNIEDINWGKKAFFRETGQTLENDVLSKRSHGLQTHLSADFSSRGDSNAGRIRPALSQTGCRLFVSCEKITTKLG